MAQERGGREIGPHVEDGELQISLTWGTRGDRTGHDWYVPTEGDQPEVESKAELRDEACHPTKGRQRHRPSSNAERAAILTAAYAVRTG